MEKQNKVSYCSFWKMENIKKAKEKCKKIDNTRKGKINCLICPKREVI